LEPQTAFTQSANEKPQKRFFKDMQQRRMEGDLSPIYMASRRCAVWSNNRPVIRRSWVRIRPPLALGVMGWKASFTFATIRAEKRM